jgi:hypothetical protein
MSKDSTFRTTENAIAGLGDIPAEKSAMTGTLIREPADKVLTLSTAEVEPAISLTAGATLGDRLPAERLASR